MPDIDRVSRGLHYLLHANAVSERGLKSRVKCDHVVLHEISLFVRNEITDEFAIKCGLEH